MRGSANRFIWPPARVTTGSIGGSRITWSPTAGDGHVTEPQALQRPLLAGALMIVLRGEKEDPGLLTEA